MALATTQLKDAILKALEESSQQTIDTDSIIDNYTQSKNAREETAKKLAFAIETFVKSGTVNTTVATTGSATAQTGTGTGAIS